MSHLTEEQFEEILPDGATIPDHVEQCIQCRARLVEKRRLAGRVREAFASVEASPELADRVRASIRSSQAHASAEPRRPCTIILSMRGRLWSGLAAAAAVLILGVLTMLYINTTPDARAARTELVAIHQQNLHSLGDSYIHDDPKELATYLSSRTGHARPMPCPKCGRQQCDCCVRQFRGRSAGNHLLRTETGLVSVVVAADTPKSLGLTPADDAEESGSPLWQGACEGCQIASIRLDGRSYYAIGQVSAMELKKVLHNLVD